MVLDGRRHIDSVLCFVSCMCLVVFALFSSVFLHLSYCCSQKSENESKINKAC